MGKHKDETGQTRVGKFLKDVGADSILQIAGNLTGIDALTEIGKAIAKDGSITPEQKAEAMQMLSLDIQDRESARKMQAAALQQDDKFSKRFVYYFAIFWSLVAAAYIFAITFFDIINTRAADTILGFLMGTIIASITTYFYGSSAGSKNKENAIKQIESVFLNKIN